MSGRVAPDPPLAEVVQRRLAALLAEIPARRAIGEPLDDARWRVAAGSQPDGAGGTGLAPEPRGARAWPAAASPPGASSRAGAGATHARESVALGAPGGRPADQTSFDAALDLLAASAPAADGGVPDAGAPARASIRLAEPARRAWEFARAHLVAVGVVVLTGCLWAGYQVVQARSTPVAAATPVVVSPTPATSSSPTPTPTPAVVLVHVLGEVVGPGVVRLAEGDRVADAIEAAGGLTERADPGELNLAAVVADGTQVVIGTRGQPRGEVRVGTDPGDGGTAGGTGAGAGGQKVSLNTATEAELDTLAGVGPVTAARIVAWRAEHGRFTRIEELQEVDGIGPRTFAELAPHVSL
jgi:competence protein ComEA